MSRPPSRGRFGAVFAIDKETAACTLLSRLSGQQFNGLTFLPKANGTEVLIGTSVAGELWQIDPAGVAPSVQVGDYGGQVSSSGDIVSVTGFGTVATVKNGSELDYLARIDEVTGAATISGPPATPTSGASGTGATGSSASSRPTSSSSSTSALAPPRSSRPARRTGPAPA